MNGDPLVLNLRSAANSTGTIIRAQQRRYQLQRDIRIDTLGSILAGAVALFFVVAFRSQSWAPPIIVGLCVLVGLQVGRIVTQLRDYCRLGRSIEALRRTRYAAAPADPAHRYRSE